MNLFFVSYYDIVGKKVTQSLEDILGFYDGKGIFFSYNGKPYELLYLGSISILRYQHYYEKSLASQFFSLSVLGGTTTGVEKINEVYFDLRSNRILARNDKNFEILISSDSVFYSEYKKDRKTIKYIKPII